MKENLCKSFNVWDAEQVQQQLAEGTVIDEVKVDMRMSVMKECVAKWIVLCYDYLQNNKQIVYNGFKEASIVDALQNPPTTQTIDDEILLRDFVMKTKICMCNKDCVIMARLFIIPVHKHKIMFTIIMRYG